MNTTTEKKRFTTRDVMVIAAMMVLTFAVYDEHAGGHCAEYFDGGAGIFGLPVGKEDCRKAPCQGR